MTKRLAIKLLNPNLDDSSNINFTRLTIYNNNIKKTIYNIIKRTKRNSSLCKACIVHSSAMKIKKKGQVHPSPPLPSFPSSSSKLYNCLSVLTLLPAVILLLLSSLSPEDKQVLAYLITRSLKTTTPTTPAGSCEGARADFANRRGTH